MSTIKTGTNLGLSTIAVDIEDLSYLSAYFNVTEFNPNFGVGKNCIVINGTDDALLTSEVFAEAHDSIGNYIFIEKALFTDAVSKKSKYILSFYVYEEHESGPGELILVSKTSDNKTVRWKTNIVINNNIENKSFVRFYKQPEFQIVSEILPATNTVNEINPKIATGSGFTLAYNPGRNFDILNSAYRKNLLDYRLIDFSAAFSSSLDNFNINLLIRKVRDYNSQNEIVVNRTASIGIKGVKNSTTLLLESPYVYEKNGITEITDADYYINYNDFSYNTASFGQVNRITEAIDLFGNTRFKKYSYATINYKNLATFSGKIAKHRVYRKSLNLSGDFQLILDETMLQKEILRDPFTPNKNFENIGSFYNQFHVNNFWFTSSADLSLQYDNGTFIDGIKIISNNSPISSYAISKINSDFLPRSAEYVPYVAAQNTGSSVDSNFIHLFKNTSYTLEMNAFINNTLINANTKLHFYITSSTDTLKNELRYNSVLGYKIGTVDFNSPRYIGNSGKIQSFDFELTNDLDGGTLVIYPEGITEVLISNISLKPTDKFGFTSDSYSTKVLFPLNTPGEIYEIKSELYDTSGNLAYSNLHTVKAFDINGETLPPELSFTAGQTIIIPDNLIISGSAEIYGQLIVRDSVFGLSGFTGSLMGTASMARTASHLNYPNNSTASYAMTASFATNAGGAILITGSTYPITASWSLTSSYSIINYITSSELSTSSSISSSYALTASYALNGGGGGGGGITSGSIYNITSSWSYNSATASYVRPLIQDVVITGSLTVSGSNTFKNIGPTILSGSTSISGSLNIKGNSTISGSLSIESGIFTGTSSAANTASYLPPNLYQITASWATYAINTPGLITNAETSSHLSYPNNSTSSYAITASYALNGGNGGIVDGGSYNISASWASSSVSSSFSFTASYVMASAINGTVTSASHAITASYVLSSESSLTTGSTYPVTSSWAIKALTASFISGAMGTITTLTASTIYQGGTDGLIRFNSNGRIWQDSKFYYNSGSVSLMFGSNSAFVSATGPYSFAHGLGTNSSTYGVLAIGTASHAEGRYTKAYGHSSHAEGQSTIASGSDSHAEGQFTTAYGDASHAEGYYSMAVGNYSHADGYYATASGSKSHVIGEYVSSSAGSSIMIGAYLTANQTASYNTALGTNSSVIDEALDKASVLMQRTDPTAISSWNYLSGSFNSTYLDAFYTSGSLDTINPYFWGNFIPDLNMTFFSVRNPENISQGAYYAVTKKHVMNTGHMSRFYGAAGTVNGGLVIPSGSIITGSGPAGPFWWLTKDGIEISRSVVAWAMPWKQLGGGISSSIDEAIMLLNEDLPDGVIPVKFLPSGSSDFSSVYATINDSFMPCIYVDQYHKRTWPASISETTPTTLRSKFASDPWVAGNSGSPVFIYTKKGSVLVKEISGPGGSISLSWLDEVNGTINLLSPSEGYAVETASITLQDLSDLGYTRDKSSKECSTDLIGSTINIHNKTNFKNSVLIDFDNVTTLAGGGQSVISIIETGSYNAAFFDYVAISQSNIRSGTVIGSFLNNTSSYTEYTTNDIGNTSNITMSIDLIYNKVRLLASTPISQSWTIKAYARYL